ncbi:PPA1309 family protein [Saccharopolyspora pogona]|uniref:PPA1309 family protein n=1 Tax=Saccharopolyspora pogona TaxID=333966 RepID=UPI0016873FFC|nr:PPA1309 family protein [Saccharopolyspora pogona]
MPPETPEDLAAALTSAAREIEEFVDAAGWDQPTQVFALVSTGRLLAAEPGLADQLDPNAPLTPIAQEALPAEDLAEALGRIEWPEQVSGCALVQEIVVLPPEAEAELPGDAEEARQIAAEHPERREARLVAAVLRDGGEACVMRLRAPDAESGGEVIQDPSLAPNLLTALHATFAE